MKDQTILQDENEREYGESHKRRKLDENGKERIVVSSMSSQNHSSDEG